MSELRLSALQALAAFTLCYEDMRCCYAASDTEDPLERMLKIQFRQHSCEFQADSKQAMLNYF